MMASLRVRVALVMLAVAGAAVAATALLFSRSVEVAYTRVETAAEASRAAEALWEHFRRERGWTDAAEVLGRVGPDTDHYLVLAGPDGRVAAVWPATVRARVGPDHTVTFNVEEGDRVEEIVIGDVPHEEIRDADGALVGTLYVGPGLADRPRSAFSASISRSLAWVVAGVLVAVIVSTLLLTRRIVRPVEALTEAARRMERGDLSHRVDAPASGEVGELARAFNRMADSLARADELRRAMVGDVAHELRTPLTNIRCHIEAMQDGLMPADAATLSSLHEEAMHLGRLVDDLRDLALADAGQLALEREPVDVGRAVEAAVAAAAPRAAAAGVTLDAAPGVDLPAVQADALRLAQVLRNLLENAIAHTPAGGRVEVAAAGAGGGVEIAVRDTGEGIAAEHLDRVFERFYRTDGSRARATGGAGLGLAIVRQLVEAQGGTVRVESAPGRGATFAVTLPVAPS
jgi:signal transduction histidine kinase